MEIHPERKHPASVAEKLLTLAAEIPSEQDFFKVAEDDLMGNDFDLVILRKEDLGACQVMVADIDLVKDRHEQFRPVGKHVVYLADQLAMEFLIGIVDASVVPDIHAEHAKIFQDLLNGLQNDLLLIQV